MLFAARSKLDSHVKEVLEFALAEPRDKPTGVEIVWELRGCRDFIGEATMTALGADPPTTSLAVQGWGRAVWTFTQPGHRREYVQRFLDSENPALVLLACEAMGNQLESEGGEYALQRLEAARGKMSDQELSARAGLHIAELRFRLHKTSRTAAEAPKP